MADSKEFPTNIQLHTLASEIGHEQEQIAAHLHIKQAEVERIERDHRTAHNQNFQLLLNWRERTPLDAEKRRDLLMTCMKKSRRQDLAKIIQKLYREFKGAGSGAEAVEHDEDDQESISIKEPDVYKPDLQDMAAALPDLHLSLKKANLSQTEGKFATTIDSKLTVEETHYVLYISPCVCRITIPGSVATAFVLGSALNQQTQIAYVCLLTCYHTKIDEAFQNPQTRDNCYAEFCVSSCGAAVTAKLLPFVLCSDAALDYAMVCVEQTPAMQDIPKMGGFITNLKPGTDEPLIIIGHEAQQKIDYATHSVQASQVIAEPAIQAIQRTQQQSQGLNIEKLYDSRFTFYQCHSFHGSSGGLCFSAKKKTLYAMHCGGIFTRRNYVNSQESVAEYGVLLWEVITDIVRKVASPPAGGPSNKPLDVEALKELFPQLVGVML